MGCNGDLIGFDGDSMGCNGFNGDLPPSYLLLSYGIDGPLIDDEIDDLPFQKMWFPARYVQQPQGSNCFFSIQTFKN